MEATIKTSNYTYPVVDRRRLNNHANSIIDSMLNVLKTSKCAKVKSPDTRYLQAIYHPEDRRYLLIVEKVETEVIDRFAILL